MDVPVDRESTPTSLFPDGFPPALTIGTNTTGGVHHDYRSNNNY